MKNLLLSVFLLISFLTFSQNKVTYKAIVKDTTGEPLIFATAMMLNPADSSLLSFTRTDEKGFFDFKGIKNQAYILNVTYVGYAPYFKRLEPSESGEVDLGVILCKPIAQEILEVVVKAARAPLSFKGDTLEYNAASFKVPPGSTVEDLLRRLPGIEVDADGNIKAQGKDVKRVYVDGKTFFGTDPKAATRNLDAEALTKVQVYNDQSEQAKTTGVEDGKKEKVMNLMLKDEYKKGRFGKITAGGGYPEALYKAKGNINFFDQKNQLSFIAYGNNVNETDIGWEDRQEFRGNSTGNWDSESFGFLGDDGGGRRFFSFFNGAGNGFSKNAGGGANYNYFTNKSNFNFNYFYSFKDQNVLNLNNNRTFFNDSYFETRDTTTDNTLSQRHSASFRWEEKFDSLRTLVAKGSFQYNDLGQGNIQATLYNDDSQNPQNKVTGEKSDENKDLGANTYVYYSHKFKKKGPSVSFNGGFDYNNNSQDNLLRSSNTFFHVPSQIVLSQSIRERLDSKRFKTGMIFSQPFGEKFSSNVFYNFNYTIQGKDRQVDDLVAGLNDPLLSRYFTFNQTYFNTGLQGLYSHDGTDVSVGVGLQRLVYDGLFAQNPNLNSNLDTFKSSFLFFAPRIGLDHEFENGLSLWSSYGYSASAPQFNDMAPVTTVYSANYTTVGNPNLRPTSSHNFNAGLNRYNSETMSYWGMNLDLNFYNEQISQMQEVTYDPARGYLTRSMPVNVDGGMELSTNFWMNFPLVKTKLNMGPNGGISYSQTPTLVNSVLNQTDNVNYWLGLSLQYILSDKIILSSYLNGNVNHAFYDLQENLNQTSYNVSGNLNFQWNFAPKFFFESNYRLVYYHNNRLAFDRSQNLLNATVKRLFGKKNQFVLALQVFDIFNQNQIINQSATQNYFSTSVSPTLARYAMLSLTYNVRGHENKLKKNRWN